MHIAFTAVAIVMNGEVCLLSDWIRLFPFTLHHFSLDVHLQTEMQHEIIRSGVAELVCFPKLLAEWLQGEWLYSKRDLNLCEEKGKKKNTALCADLMH